MIERYQMVERRLPIFSNPKARKGRYYLRDNFLRAWLSSLASPVAAINFKPLEKLVQQADHRLHESEGYGPERIVGQLYEERSRKGLEGFALTHRIEGFWDRGETEIDLVAANEDDRIIRFGHCKRSAASLRRDLANFDQHIERFLRHHKKYENWTIEKVAIAPKIADEGERKAIAAHGYIPQDLNDLTRGM
ncbi:MAG: hypothetical protein D6731_17755 [Planctomycetota bacterium]|nr:MAG: hypothetical protein D6731_17755 [Planctomycetota bacterium]